MKTKHKDNFFQWVMPVLLLVMTSSMAMAQETVEEGSFWDSTCDAASATGQCVKGVGNFVWGFVDFLCIEPARKMHDNSVAVYYMATGDKEGAIEWVESGAAWSAYTRELHQENLLAREKDPYTPTLEFMAGRAYDHFGNKIANLGEGLMALPGIIVVKMPRDIYEAWQEGNYEKVGELASAELSVIVPAAWAASGVDFYSFFKNSTQYVPVQVGENQFSLAAVSTEVLALEGGFTIPAGATLGIFMRPDGGLDGGSGSGSSGSSWKIQNDMDEPSAWSNIDEIEEKLARLRSAKVISGAARESYDKALAELKDALNKGTLKREGKGSVGVKPPKAGAKAAAKTAPESVPAEDEDPIFRNEMQDMLNGRDSGRMPKVGGGDGRLPSPKSHGKDVGASGA